MKPTFLILWVSSADEPEPVIIPLVPASSPSFILTKSLITGSTRIRYFSEISMCPRPSNPSPALVNF